MLAPYRPAVGGTGAGLAPYRACSGAGPAPYRADSASVATSAKEAGFSGAGRLTPYRAESSGMGWISREIWQKV
ncbi:MAG: hypothetical protein COV69_00105 [Parcubacteria group bacterium CG11_big_fil_rev_8_21_14_0_20_39_14]|nr:MAG: hypothetical protein COV69_00105 [Parcubacteria group bacterium CG11_big_fil_rev_8_21_14_0_20_39_14]PIS35269.1 MAG: hypothetical protein COT36_03300 [Parcubacteria group bacterium CG08_land_8_20_14_0_20_38_56]